jgi:hypothetical protein
MTHTFARATLIIGSLLIAGQALADCPGPFLRDVKRAYENGKAAESAGRKEDALFAYHAAEGSTCEGTNPYEADAAKRAVTLARELGLAAERAKDFDKASRIYDAGGLYAAADGAYIQLLRSKADDYRLYESALQRFRNRDEASFTSNNAAAVKAAGAYSPDPKWLAEINAMPAKALERGLAKESASFSEPYLQEYVKLVQGQTDDPTDANAFQRSISAQQAFAQKWKGEDPLKASRDALDNMRMWGIIVNDSQYSNNVTTKITQLVEMRATSLRTKFFGAPKLLDAAMDYYRLLGSENNKLEGQLAAIRAQALKLGDEANGKNRLMLAAEYYEVADASDKAQSARDRAQQASMQKMQPSIDQARKQAEAMAAQYGDPAKVEEMKRQAEAMRKAMENRAAAGGR